MRLRVTFRLVGIAALGAATIFLALTISQNWQNLQTEKLHADGALIGASAGCLILFWLFQSALWRSTYRRLGDDTRAPQAVFLYLVNNALAYVPGKVANLLGTFAVAGRLGVWQADELIPPWVWRKRCWREGECPAQ